MSKEGGARMLALLGMRPREARMPRGRLNFKTGQMRPEDLDDEVGEFRWPMAVTRGGPAAAPLRPA